MIKKSKWFSLSGLKESTFQESAIKIHDTVGTPSGYYILWANCEEASSSILQFWQVNMERQSFLLSFRV